jgi:hypothetical protein
MTMASNEEPDSGTTCSRPGELEKRVTDLDLPRLRVTDFSRYWPATRIALCLMADSAQPSFAGVVMAIVRLGDAVCSGEG